MLIAAAALYMRVRDPLFSTAYMDESIYVVYGRMFLARHFESPLDTPLQWSFGWYLWPAMAALADRVAGLAGLRELAAGLGTVTVAATYGFASRVFSKSVGLAAAMIMAVIAPAVLVSRIATRDSGSISFFAVGLWAFAAGWQENKKRYWFLAALSFFAAFLCKYLVAIYFPVLVLLSLRKGWRPAAFLMLPLTAACAAYGLLHFADLRHLLGYGAGYAGLRAPDPWIVYAQARPDLVLLGMVSLVAFASRLWRARAAWLWLGACIILLFQWKSRADYDFWKHVNYALLFLVPLAAAGIVVSVKILEERNYGNQVVWSTGATLALVVGLIWLGQPQNIRSFLFWPNVDPVLAYFDGRLGNGDRVLVDDTVFRYYFFPPLHQDRITDPMYFHYRDAAGHDAFGEDAYKAAVGDGAFSYLIFDGGMGEEARRMDAAVRPSLSNYQLQMSALDPVLGQKIEIYARNDASATQPQIENQLQTKTGPSIRLLTPPSGAVVNTQNKSIEAEGVTTGSQPGWFAEMDVFTDRWYPQGDRIPVAPDGSFHQKIFLGGEGPQQCYHLVRARLFDVKGRQQATVMNYGVGRAGPPNACPVLQAQ